MSQGFNPKINFNTMKLDGGISMSGNVNSINAPESNFKNVVGGLLKEFNEQANAPQQLTQDVMLDKADIHDVMVAIAQADINVNIATKFAGKIVQTYEKIMQIQI